MDELNVLIFWILALKCVDSRSKIQLSSGRWLSFRVPAPKHREAATPATTRLSAATPESQCGPDHGPDRGLGRGPDQGPDRGLDPGPGKRLPVSAVSFCASL